MDRLPNEIWQEITRLLALEDEDTWETRCDLSSLRLTSNTLNACATPYFFHTVPLWIGKRSLDHLTAVAEHPVISKHVKVIEFSPLRFAANNEDPTFSGASSVLQRASTTPEDAKLSFVQYQMAYEEYLEAQRLLSESERDCQILSTALIQLPHLTAIHIALSSRWVGAKELTNAMILPLGNEFDYSCHDAFRVLSMALRASGVRLTSLRFDKGDDQKFERYGPSEMIEIMKKAKPRCDGRPCYPITWWSDYKPSAQSLHALFALEKQDTQTFESLEDLEVSHLLKTSWLDSENTQHRRWDSMCTTLQTLTHRLPVLRRLTINQLRNEVHHTPFSPLLSTITFSMLEEVNLDTFAADSSDTFASFFTRHSCTLKRVKLRNIYLTPYHHWEIAAAAMHEYRFPVLQYFQISLSALDLPRHVESSVNLTPYLTHWDPRNPMIEPSSDFEEWDLFDYS